ncbi:MAG: nucleotidyltransferase family protein [Anaerolineae bacterium]|nr:nucleotidyltransferase family protein [Anaerolineae bacterium]
MTTIKTWSLDALQHLRETIIQIAHEHHASNIRIFGSVARGDTNPHSDVDILVQFDDQASIFDEVALWNKLQDLLQCDVDLSSDDTLKSYMRDAILDEAIPL